MDTTKSLKQLDNCIVIAQNTETIGNNILSELDNQEQTIKSIEKKAQNVKVPLNRSGFTLSNMIVREKYKTLLQIIILIVCFVIFISLIILISHK